MEKMKKKGWLKWQAASLITAALVCVLAGVAAPVRGKADMVDDDGEGNKVLILSSGDGGDVVEDAFRLYNNITTVRFDDSVTEIPYGILYNKSSVTTVEFQGEVTSVGDRAFNACSALKEIDLSSAEVIGDGAFHGCSALKEINLSSAEVIGKGAFFGCQNLSTVILAEGLKSIGGTAFFSTAFTEIKLPGTVTSIGASAFDGCRKLSTVTLNEGLVSIQTRAFVNCSVLTEIEIPSSVKTIGDHAFLNTGLKEFRYPAGLTISNIGLPSGSVTISYTVDGNEAKTYTCDNNNHDMTTKENGVYGCSRCDYVYRPTITQQPSNVTVEEGGEAVFSVAASGDGVLSYQWQVSEDNGNTWTGIDGADSAAYTLDNVQAAWSGRQYRCVITDSKGTAYSGAAALTVTTKPEPPVSEETEETPPAPELPVPETPEETPAAPEETEAPIETQESQPAVTAEEEQSAREGLNQQVQAGKTYNRLRWTRVKGADGYLIYGSKCSSGDKKHKMKELKTIASGRKTSWTHKGLKKNTWYKYQIVAYKLVNGKQVEIGSSVSLHSLTQGDGRYANPVRVKVSRTKITLKKGRSTVIKAEAALPKGKKTEYHTEEIRYVVSDPEIVSVTKNGKIKGKKKGNCTVYAVAQNGVYEKIRVKVK